jgi:hypothetical protein
MGDPASHDDINRLWEELRMMEGRINARFDRVSIDLASRHASNAQRLDKLDALYWQSIGVGRFGKALWAVLGALGWAIISAIWWFKDHWK